MSYCYNCGVELLNTEAVCPLCHRKICNIENGAAALKRAYPANLEKVPQSNKRLAVIGLIILLIPALCCLAADILDNGKINWGPYLWGAEGCIFVYLFLPELFSKLRLIIRFVLNAVVTAGYLYLIGLTANATNWVLPLGLPITLLASALLYSFIKTAKTAKISLLVKLCIFIGATGLFSVAVEAVIGLYGTAKLVLNWSLLVLFPSLVIVGILFCIESSRTLRDKIRQILSL